MSTAYGLHVKTYFYVHCLWSPRTSPFYVHWIWYPRKSSTAYNLHINKTDFYVHCIWSPRKNSFLCPLHMISTQKPISMATAYGLHVKTYFYVHCIWSPRKSHFHVNCLWSPHGNSFLCPLHMVST